MFVQYAIKQCDVDGEYYSKFYEMCRGWSKDGEAEESARVAGASAAGRKDTRRKAKVAKKALLTRRKAKKHEIAKKKRAPLFS